MKTKTLLTLALAVAAGLLLTSCVGYRSITRHAEPNSLVQFLYPEGTPRTHEPTIPVLKLPLKVGVAFVPPGEGQRRRNVYDIPEEQKLEVMENVASHFRDQPFVLSIDIIPSLYLRPGGGFTNLDQVGRFLDIDVIVLLAADQVQYLDENIGSLLYLTIVGAFLVPGESHTTHTMMEAAVFHLPSRQLLFRAPGMSQEAGVATAMSSDRRSREHSHAGYWEASTDLAANLARELALFEERVKEEPERYQVERRPGYAGRGSFSPAGGVPLLLALAIGLWVRRRSPG